MPELGWEYKTKQPLWKISLAVLQVIKNKLTICCGFSIRVLSQFTLKLNTQSIKPHCIKWQSFLSDWVMRYQSLA